MTNREYQLQKINGGTYRVAGVRVNALTGQYITSKSASGAVTARHSSSMPQGNQGTK